MGIDIEMEKYNITTRFPDYKPNHKHVSKTQTRVSCAELHVSRSRAQFQPGELTKAALHNALSYKSGSIRGIGHSAPDLGIPRGLAASNAKKYKKQKDLDFVESSASETIEQTPRVALKNLVYEEATSEMQKTLTKSEFAWE